MATTATKVTNTTLEIQKFENDPFKDESELHISYLIVYIFQIHHNNKNKYS